MPRYRKKPVEVDAILWTGHNIDEVMKFIFEDDRWKSFCSSSEYVGILGIDHTPELGTIDIPTLEGTMTVRADDFIIRGLKGELYPCKPDIFENSYEIVL